MHGPSAAVIASRAVGAHDAHRFSDHVVHQAAPTRVDDCDRFAVVSASTNRRAVGRDNRDRCLGHHGDSSVCGGPASDAGAVDHHDALAVLLAQPRSTEARQARPARRESGVVGRAGGAKSPSAEEVKRISGSRRAGTDEDPLLEKLGTSNSSSSSLIRRVRRRAETQNHLVRYCGTLVVPPFETGGDDGDLHSSPSSRRPPFRR